MIVVDQLAEQAPEAPSKVRKAHGRIAAAIAPWLLLAPAIILIAVFRIVPFVEGIWLSMTEWDGFNAPRWIGFRNYSQLLQDHLFIGSLTHNLFFLLAIPLWVGLPYLTASLIHRAQFGARAIRVAVFLPVVLPAVAVGVLFTDFLGYNGALNSILRGLGVNDSGHSWLVRSSTALGSVIAVVIWASFGIGVVIFVSAMSAVNPDLEDAARIEGCSWLQTQRYVVLPAVRSAIALWTVVLVIISLSQTFPFVFTLTQGGPANDTYTLDFYVYQEALGQGRFGYAAAGGMALFVVVAVPLLLLLAGVKIAGKIKRSAR